LLRISKKVADMTMGSNVSVYKMGYAAGLVISFKLTSVFSEENEMP